MRYYENNYHFSQKDQERDLKIIWKCGTCGNEREDYPRVNEDGIRFFLWWSLHGI